MTVHWSNPEVAYRAERAVVEASQAGWRPSRQEPTHDALPLEDIALRTTFFSRQGWD